MLTPLGALVLGAAIVLTVELKILSDKPDLDGRLRALIQSSATTIVLMVLLTIGIATEIKYFLTISMARHVVLTTIWMVGVPVLALVAAVLLVRRQKRPPGAQA